MISSEQFHEGPPYRNTGEIGPAEVMRRLYRDPRDAERAKRNAQRAETIRGSGDWDDMGLREMADELYDKHVGDRGPSVHWDEMVAQADEEIGAARTKAWAEGNHAHANYMARMLPTFKNQWGKRIMGPSVPGTVPHPRTPREA